MLNFCFNLISFLDLAIFSLAVLSLLVILIFYFYFFIRLYFYKNKESTFNKPVSIIICAKNEIENLKKKLPSILKQNYFNFEVIVVNDQSTDDTALFLDELSKKYKHLKIVDIDNFVTNREGKKFALTLGIKTAKYEYLLLTDADCFPVSKNWVKKMSSNFNNANIILGYGSYEKKKSFLNKMIRFDTFNVAQQYLSFALAGETYMGVGRNLAYKKSLFFKNKGVASHMHIPSGDDDLFIQEIANENTIAIEVSKDSHTQSAVIQNWRDWIYQKRRHLSTAPLYRNKLKVLLGIYPFAQLLFFLSIILLCIFQIDIYYIIILLFIKLTISYLINYRLMKVLNIFDLYLFHPFYEILHLFIQGNFVLLNLFKKPKKWSR